MFKRLKKKAMMLGVTAGPFFFGLIIGLVIAFLVVYFMFRGASWLCPAV